MEQPPERVGPYELAGELGRGGMGTVFRAVDARSGAEVALKLLGVSDERARLRLLAEARALSRLRHRNLVSLLEAGEHRGRPWLALELVRGRSLEERLAREGPLAPREAALLARAVAAGLAHAHREGVLHRDLKPANVLLPADGGEPKLSDFGLAGFTEVDPGHSRLTRSGVFLGTPGYWAPEQAAGDRAALGPATDVYGLGALLYAALTGRPPVEAETLADVLVATARTRPAPTGADPALEALVLRCLEKRPEDRPPSVEAVARDLSRWLASGGGRRRGARGRVAALGALLLAGAGVWWVARGSSPPARTAAAPAPAAPTTATASPPRWPDETDEPATPELLAELAAAREQAARGDYGEALGSFERALARDPRSARALAGRGFCRAGLGDLQGAIADLDAALALRPDYAFALAKRGLCRSLLGDDAGALADADRAIALGLGGPAVFGNRGITRARLGDHAGAVEDFGRAIALEPGQVSFLVERAASYEDLGQRAAAVRDCDLALAIAPDHAGALTNRGLSRSGLGDLLGALVDFDRALAIDPGSALVLTNRGCTRLQLGDYRGALVDFDRALELDPDDASALGSRAMTRKLLDDHAGAVADYDRLLARAPGADAHADRASSRAVLGDVEGALADYDRALELTPPGPARGRLERARGELAEHLAAASGGRPASPPDAPRDGGAEPDPRGGEALAARAARRLAAKDPAGALRDAEEALRGSPPAPRASVARTLGLARYGLGQEREALPDLEAALRAAPDDLEVALTTGYAARKQQASALAVDAFRAARRVYRARGETPPWNVPFNLAGALGTLHPGPRTAEQVAEMEEAYRESHALQEAQARGGVAWPILRLAQVLLDTGRLDEAERAIDEGEAITRRTRNPAFQLDVRMMRVNHLVARGRPAEAVTLGRETVLAHPGEWNAHTVLAGALLAQGELEEARVVATEAVRLAGPGGLGEVPARGVLARVEAALAARGEEGR